MTYLNFEQSKKIIVNSLLTIIIFTLYFEFQDYEILRKKIGDFGFDQTIIGFSYISSNNKNDSPLIIVVGIDDKYIEEMQLVDEQGNLKFNYTPRYIFEDILANINISKEFVQKYYPSTPQIPKAVILDYLFLYPGDMNGSITLDDKILIDSLNKYSNFYPIYLPTTKKGIFLENQSLNSNVHFVSMECIRNDDGKIRAYNSYIDRNNSVIEHIAIKLFDNAYTKIIPYENRILYKVTNEEMSMWENIVYYSASDFKNSIINQNFNNSIILIGSNYKNSGDIHETIIGKMSGVFVLANAIATKFATKSHVELASYWTSIQIYLIVLCSIQFLVLVILNAMKIYTETLYQALTFILVGIILYFCSIIFLYFYQILLNWAIPLIVYELLEQQKNIKKIFSKFYINKSQESS